MLRMISSTTIQWKLIADKVVPKRHFGFDCALMSLVFPPPMVQTDAGTAVLYCYYLARVFVIYPNLSLLMDATRASHSS